MQKKPSLLDNYGLIIEKMDKVTSFSKFFYQIKLKIVFHDQF